MPRIDISQLPDESRIWIFGISPALDERKESRVLAAVDPFLDAWVAHGEPIVSARDLLHGSFLLIAVDERSETSGCSIDRMFGLLRQLEHDLSVSILDADRIFVRGSDNAVQAMSRARFRDTAESGTIIFDTVAERLSAIRSGKWQRPARESWHGQLIHRIS